MDWRWRPPTHRIDRSTAPTAESAALPAAATTVAEMAAVAQTVVLEGSAVAARQ